MSNLRNMIRGIRLARNPDLLWLAQNLAPQIYADLTHTSGGMGDRSGTRRNFLFEGRDITAAITFQDNNHVTVAIWESDDRDVFFNFGLRNGLARSAPVVRAGDDHSKDMVSALAARLRAFGEHYLANPVSHFNYATPGEYLKWPDRSAVEPPRDPDYMPLEDIDAMINPVVRRIDMSGVMYRKDDPAARAAAVAEIKQLNDLRDTHMAKTTYGRWLAINGDPQWARRLAVPKVADTHVEGSAPLDEPQP